MFRKIRTGPKLLAKSRQNQSSSGLPNDAKEAAISSNIEPEVPSSLPRSDFVENMSFAASTIRPFVFRGASDLSSKSNNAFGQTFLPTKQPAFSLSSTAFSIDNKEEEVTTTLARQEVSSVVNDEVSTQSSNILSTTNGCKGRFCHFGRFSGGKRRPRVKSNLRARKKSFWHRKAAGFSNTLSQTIPRVKKVRRGRKQRVQPHKSTFATTSVVTESTVTTTAPTTTTTTTTATTTMQQETEKYEDFFDAENDLFVASSTVSSVVFRGSPSPFYGLFSSPSPSFDSDAQVFRASPRPSFSNIGKDIDLGPKKTLPPSPNQLAKSELGENGKPLEFLPVRSFPSFPIRPKLTFPFRPKQAVDIAPNGKQEGIRNNSKTTIEPASTETSSISTNSNPSLTNLAHQESLVRLPFLSSLKKSNTFESTERQIEEASSTTSTQQPFSDFVSTDASTQRPDDTFSVAKELFADEENEKTPNLHTPKSFRRRFRNGVERGLNPNIRVEFQRAERKYQTEVPTKDTLKKFFVKPDGRKPRVKSNIRARLANKGIIHFKELQNERHGNDVEDHPKFHFKEHQQEADNTRKRAVDQTEFNNLNKEQDAFNWIIPEKRKYEEKMLQVPGSPWSSSSNEYFFDDHIQIQNHDNREAVKNDPLLEPLTTTELALDTTTTSSLSAFKALLMQTKNSAII